VGGLGDFSGVDVSLLFFLLCSPPSAVERRVTAAFFSVLLLLFALAQIVSFRRIVKLRFFLPLRGCRSFVAVGQRGEMDEFHVPL